MSSRSCRDASAVSAKTSTVRNITTAVFNGARRQSSVSESAGCGKLLCSTLVICSPRVDSIPGPPSITNIGLDRSNRASCSKPASVDHIKAKTLKFNTTYSITGDNSSGGNSASVKKDKIHNNRDNRDLKMASTGVSGPKMLQTTQKLAKPGAHFSKRLVTEHGGKQKEISMKEKLRNRDGINIVEIHEERIMAADVPYLMQAHALRCAREVKSQLDFTLRNVASTLKKEFDKAYGPAWHCIVGTKFGSFVTHSMGGFLYFSVDKVSILLFKTTVQVLQ